MIPYFDIPVIRLGPLEIHAFGVLVALGILVGADRTRKRARQLGLTDEPTSVMITWVVVCGFIISHMFDVLTYQPGEMAHAELPGWIASLVDKLPDAGRAFFSAGWFRGLVFLLNPTAGISSFGGFIGSLLTLIWWSRRNRYPLLAAVDSLIFGLSVGWLFGRLGCFTAHDHPGEFTNFFLGVRYPEGVRHDLGLDEAVFAFFLAIAFAILGRKVRRIGFYPTVAALVYGPLRFGLDFLRVREGRGADPRYFGLTPAQYGAIVMTLAGVGLAVYITRRPVFSAVSPAPVPPPAQTDPPPPPTASTPPTTKTS